MPHFCDRLLSLFMGQRCNHGSKQLIGRRTDVAHVLNHERRDFRAIQSMLCLLYTSPSPRDSTSS
eukprot:1321342-Prorocentrum_lima.AAC.1